MQQYVWLIWSSLSLFIWAIIFFSLKNKERKEMFFLSLWISLFGLTQPLWVPEYWNPPSIFKFYSDFDIESIIFSFGTGGIAVVVYRSMFPIISKPIKKHKHHLLALLSGPVVFIFLLAISRINNLYFAIAAMMVGGLFSFFLRPDLRRRMFVGAGACTAIYFGYFLMLVVIFPGYIEQVWNLKALSGILILGIPLEELIFATSLGFLWPSIYEYIREHIRDKN